LDNLSSEKRICKSLYSLICFTEKQGNKGKQTENFNAAKGFFLEIVLIFLKNKEITKKLISLSSKIEGNRQIKAKGFSPLRTKKRQKQNLNSFQTIKLYKNFKTKQTMKTRNSIRLTFKVMLIVMAFGVTQNALSQVTIGSGVAPDSNALLDLKEDGATTRGLLLPRVHLQAENLFIPMTAHVEGMVVYNLAFSPEDTDVENRVRPGIYYNTGIRWERLYVGHTNWFYMPSIIINVESEGPHEIDLYAEYLSQFYDIPERYASPGAPAIFKNILQSDEIFYYITGYDKEVFTIEEISEDGVLIYTVNVEKVTEATHMNIVFVEKKNVAQFDNR